MAGRKTKLTPLVQEKIVKAIRAGNYAYVAAQYAGISQASFYGWLIRGEAEKERLSQNGARPRKAETVFVEFLEAIKSAEAQAEAIRVAMITKASQETWQAAAWWLERKFPDRWARKDKHHHTWQSTLPDGSDPDEVKRQFAAMLAAARLANERKE